MTVAGRDIRIVRFLGHSEADHGERLMIGFLDQHGIQTLLSIPQELDGEFLVHFDAAAQEAAKKRALNPTGVFRASALEVDYFEVGPATKEKVLFRIGLRGSMKLDLGIDKSALGQLRESLDRAELKLAKGTVPRPS